MKKQNGFVLVETLIVVLLLTVTLMSLYSTFSSIMLKTRAKSKNDTIDTIYKTYFVKDLLDNLYYNAETKENYVDSFSYYASIYNTGLCKAFSYDNVRDNSARMTSSGNVIEVCDFSEFLNNDSFSSDPLYDVVKTYNIEKIYYLNFNKLAGINDDNLKYLYNTSYFDASSIDYFKGQGKDLDGSFIVIKYLKDYLNPNERVSYVDDSGNTVNVNLVDYMDDSFRITKDAYHSKISLNEVVRKESIAPLAFYSDAGKSEHYYLDNIPDDTEYVLPVNIDWGGHAGYVIVGWVTNPELLQEGEYDKCLNGASTVTGKCFKANTAVKITNDTRELYAVWCGDGTLKGAMECQMNSFNGSDGLTKTDKDGNFDANGNFVYKGTGGDQNFVAIGNTCFNLISNFNSPTGIKAIYYGDYSKDRNECGDRQIYSKVDGYSSSDYYGSNAYKYNEVIKVENIGTSDDFAMRLGFETKVTFPISRDGDIPYNEYVYYGDKVSYDANTNKYTLLKSDNSKVTDKVLFYASEQAEYKDLKQYLNKYFCYGGKTNTCDTIYYLTTLDATKAKLSAFTFKNGQERSKIGNNQIALSDSFTYSNGKYRLNTSNMYYVKINDFVTAKNNSSGDIYKKISSHRYACSDWVKRADGDSYECNSVNFIYSLVNNGSFFTYENGKTKMMDIYDAVNGSLTQSEFGKDKDVRKNDSNAKRVLDNFFKNSFVGKSENGVTLTDLIDYNVTYCNNMEPYLYFPLTEPSLLLFMPNRYISIFNPTTSRMDQYSICGQKFLYSMDTSNGNGLLDYPVGLITLNEGYYAGLTKTVDGQETVPNHYLNNIGFTMTPSGGYNEANSVYHDRLFAFYSGKNYYWPSTVGNWYGLDPVISVKMDNHIISGNGSKSNPFVFGGA